MVFDASLLNTQQYKLRIKGTSQEKKLCPPLLHGVVDTEKGAFGSTSTPVLIFI